MERDELKIKLSECELLLQNFHIEYDKTQPSDKDKSTSVAEPSSASSKDSGSMHRKRHHHHHSASQRELERCERELNETKSILEAERAATEELRMTERATFEKAATLEAVANSLKQRLDSTEKTCEDALSARDALRSENDAMKLEISELRQLMVKQQSIVDMASRSGRVTTTEKKNSAREARLERVRQKAREQMSSDTNILTGRGAEGDGPSSQAQEGDVTRTKIVWDQGRPLAVAWDSDVGGLVLQEPGHHQQQQAAAAAALAAATAASSESKSSHNTDAIAKLEARLAKTEMSSEKLEILLQAERERNKMQTDALALLKPVLEMPRGYPQQHQQKYPTAHNMYATGQGPHATQTQHDRHGAGSTEISAAAPSHHHMEPLASHYSPQKIEDDYAASNNNLKANKNNPALTISPVSKAVMAPAANQSSELPTSSSTTSASSNESKKADWEQDYQAYFVEKDQEEKQQQELMKHKQEELNRANVELLEMEKTIKEQEAAAAAAAAAVAKVKSEAEAKAQEEAAAEIAAAAQQKKQKEQEAEKKLREEEEEAAAALERERENQEKEKKAAILEEERRRWQVKDEERREKKRAAEEKARLEKEEKEREEEQKRRAAENRNSAAVKIQSHRRRKSAQSSYSRALQEKAESMSAAEKAKLEREKEAAVAASKKKREEDEKRSAVEKEHEEARQRAAERMRARAEQEAEERRRREEEERQRERRMSSGGTDSDPLEVSDGSMESFSSDNYDDW